MAEVDDDGRVYLPAAVRKKIAEGERAFTAQFDPNAQQPTQQAEAPKAQVDVPTVQHEPQPTNPDPLETEPEPQSEPQPQPEPTPPPQAADQQERRLRTLQGRMRADAERHNAQMVEMQRQLSEAMGQITQLTTKLLTGETPSKTPDKKTLTGQQLRSITSKEREDYGDAFIDMVARAAEEVAEQLVTARVGEVQATTADLGTRLANTTKQLNLTKEQRRNKWLDDNVPGWQVQDEDPGFMDWLQEEDAFSGVQRVLILKNAMDQENFARIKTIFDGYARETGAIAPQPSPRPTATGTGRVNLAAQVLPNGGNGRVDAISSDPEAPPTADEIAKYFDRKLRRPKSLTEAEITRMERRMANALAAGTVQPRYRV
jgi:hypothetical protein